MEGLGSKEGWTPDAGRLDTLRAALARVGHDFSNLLTPLLSYPELLRAELPPGSRCIGLLDVMETAARDMTRIARAMLDFAGAGDFDPRPVGVNDLVEICLGGMRDGMPSSVAVAVMLKASPSRIMGGSEQVGICLEQLFRNALEAMPQGGSLRIETECEHSDCARSFHGLSLEPGDYVCVRIRDSGPGMSEDALAHAFQPFFTTKQDRAKRGAGLGLAYVYLVMAAHRGAVELRRPDGGGTEVALHFPAAA